MLKLLLRSLSSKFEGTRTIPVSEPNMTSTFFQLSQYRFGISNIFQLVEKSEQNTAQQK